jgi:hypothetical protein
LNSGKALELVSTPDRNATFPPLCSATLQSGAIQMADRLSDAFCRGRRAWRQGIGEYENPYGSNDERAMAWDLGWQSAQTNDELSEYVNSGRCRPQIELDSEASEELWDLINKQR